jgi:hypothetical protein
MKIIKRTLSKLDKRDALLIVAGIIKDMVMDYDVDVNELILCFKSQYRIHRCPNSGLVVLEII